VTKSGPVARCFSNPWKTAGGFSQGLEIGKAQQTEKKKGNGKMKSRIYNHSIRAFTLLLTAVCLTACVTDAEGRQTID